MVQYCAAEGIKTIGFVTNDPAIPFCVKKGAGVVGSAVSSIDGRKIPRLQYEIGQ